MPVTAAAEAAAAEMAACDVGGAWALPMAWVGGDERAKREAAVDACDSRRRDGGGGSGGVRHRRRGGAADGDGGRR